MKSVLQLKSEVLVQTFPSGVPENLALPVVDGVISPLDLLFDEAFAEIAKWVPCEQERNVNVIDFCATYFKCGMTVVEAPHGVISRVYTIANGEWCDPVFYVQQEWPGPECLARNTLIQWTTPENTGVLPVLPLGFKKAEATSDRDANGVIVGRGRAGVWAIYDEKVWVALWLQSNEKLVIEWKGLKTRYANDDQVNDDLDYRKAVKLYVQYGYERDWGDPQRAAKLHTRIPSGEFIGEFDEALADLIWQCRERTKLRRTEQCAAPVRDRLGAELVDDVVP